MIHTIEHDMERSFGLVQGGQPLCSDRLANRVIEVKPKSEGFSGKYKNKFRLNRLIRN
jgi:hypothetical protein